MPAVIPALAEINVPTQVEILTVDSLAGLVSELTERSLMGYAGQVFFGAAFIQGDRLQFTTAMPMRKMLEVAAVDRSRRHDSAREVGQHANRPTEPTHSKQLRNYLLDTACVGDKFILPSFTFNWGVGLNEDSPTVTLIVHHRGGDTAAAWPALLLFPAGAKMDITDGGHRHGEIFGIDNDPRIPQEKKDVLMRNAVDVKVVFEGNQSDSHQDFADCGKAKSLPKSLVTTFDVRDQRNLRAREMVLNTPFLETYVDATASFINLSARSKRIWSMTAVRQFVSHLVDRHHFDKDVPDAERTARATKGAEDFFSILVTFVPQFQVLDKERDKVSPKVTTGQLRDIRGGDIALRGVAMAIFALAFHYCQEHKVSFETMAQRLGTLDWHLLDCERDTLAKGPNFSKELQDHTQPLWSSLLILLGETRYRISSRMEDAEVAWKKIVTKLFEQEMQQIAAE